MLHIITTAILLVAKAFPVLEHVLNSFLRSLLATKTEKCFPLKVQKILFSNVLDTPAITAAQHVAQFAPQQIIILTDKTSPSQLVHPNL